METATRSASNPYLPSGALLRSDMPEGYVPADEAEVKATATVTARSGRWSRLVVWTLRAVASLHVLLALVALLAGILLWFGPAHGSPLHPLLDPPPEGIRYLVARNTLLAGWQHLVDGLLLVGLAEAIALISGAESKRLPHRKKGRKREARAVPSFTGSDPRHAPGT